MTETTRIPVTEATEQQLRDFATMAMGLDIASTENRAAILAKLAKVFSGKTIQVMAPVESNGVRAEGGAFSTRENPETGKHETKIIVQSQDKPGGDLDVPVSVNGVAMLIPRGKPVWVPDEYVHVLSNAYEDTYDEYTGGDGGLKGKRRVLSYPFQYA